MGSFARKDIMRLFIAILFEENIIDALTHFQDGLKAKGVKGNYSRRDNLPIKSPSIIPRIPAILNEVMDAIEQVDFKPFDIRLEGVGHFGDLFWVGIEDNPELKGYVKRLRRALSDNGIPFDRKKFSPHITLIRKAVSADGRAIPVVDAPNGEMRVARISLMKSERGKNGMAYTEM